MGGARQRVGDLELKCASLEEQVRRLRAIAAAAVADADAARHALSSSSASSVSVTASLDEAFSTGPAGVAPLSSLLSPPVLAAPFPSAEGFVVRAEQLMAQQAEDERVLEEAFKARSLVEGVLGANETRAASPLPRAPPPSPLPPDPTASDPGSGGLRFPLSQNLRVVPNGSMREAVAELRAISAALSSRTHLEVHQRQRASSYGVGGRGVEGGAEGAGAGLANTQNQRSSPSSKSPMRFVPDRAAFWRKENASSVTGDGRSVTLSSTGTAEGKASVPSLHMPSVDSSTVEALKRTIAQRKLEASQKLLGPADAASHFTRG